MAVGLDKSIHVANLIWEDNDNAINRIWKFSQDSKYASEDIPSAIADWDDDGLTTTTEVVGWDIYVEFSAIRSKYN